jgi:hypothetical protein
MLLCTLVLVLPRRFARKLRRYKRPRTHEVCRSGEATAMSRPGTYCHEARRTLRYGFELSAPG